MNRIQAPNLIRAAAVLVVNRCGVRNLTTFTNRVRLAEDRSAVLKSLEPLVRAKSKATELSKANWLMACAGEVVRTNDRYANELRHWRPTSSHD